MILVVACELTAVFQLRASLAEALVIRRPMVFLVER
jgi:hypothetical protein